MVDGDDEGDGGDDSETDASSSSGFRSTRRSNLSSSRVVKVERKHFEFGWLGKAGNGSLVITEKVGKAVQGSATKELASGWLVFSNKGSGWRRHQQAGFFREPLQQPTKSGEGIGCA